MIMTLPPETDDVKDSIHPNHKDTEPGLNADEKVHMDVGIDMDTNPDPVSSPLKEKLSSG